MIDDIHNEIDIPKKSHSLSSLDKLDWTDKIELQMWYCIRTEGIIGSYHKEVIRLESCVKTVFSGLDFYTPIQNNTNKIEMNLPNVKKKMVRSVWDFNYKPLIISDLTCRDRDLIKKRVYLWYWKQRFNFVRDLFAAKRGLMYTRQRPGGGTQMED